MRYYSSIAQAAQLSSSVNNLVTSVAVSSLAGFPVSEPFTIVVDPSTAYEEIMTVTNVSGTTLTVTRGEDSSTAVAHSAGAAVRHIMSARDLREPQEHIAATTNIHGIGVGNSTVGTDTAQVLTNKTIDGASNTVTNLAASALADETFLLPTGCTLPYAGAVAPAGFLLCDGSAVSRAAYAVLYGIVGTAFGAGDGSTTFNVPDLKGRVPVGYDAGQAEFDSLGHVGGEKTHLLTSAEMPSHTHVQNAHTHTQALGGGLGTSDKVSGGYVIGNSNSSTVSATTAINQATGGGGTHNNLQPYLALRYIIKY